MLFCSRCISVCVKEIERKIKKINNDNNNNNNNNNINNNNNNNNNVREKNCFLILSYYTEHASAQGIKFRTGREGF